jgi:hypothetical protein
MWRPEMPAIGNPFTIDELLTRVERVREWAADKAARSDVAEALHQWADDLEAEARTLETTRWRRGL